MLKRLMATLMAVILVVAVLAGCGAKQASNSNVTKITMWSADSHSKLVMEKLVNEFNLTIGKENDIEFEYIIKENDLSKQVEIGLTTGQAPDFFAMDLEKGVQNDYIVSIEDMPGGKEFIAKYDGKLQNTYHTYNGKAYRVPMSVTTMGLVYNKDMFKKAGIVDENGEALPPETIDEMVEYAKKLTNNSKREYGIVLPLKWSAWFGYEVSRSVMACNGYAAYNPVSGKFEYEGYKPFLEAIMQMKNDGSIYPGAEGLDNDPARARFAEGNIGMKISYSWDVGVFNDQFPAKCDWGVAPIPTYSKTEKYLQPTQPSWSPCINKKSAEEKDKEKLMIVYKWLVSDDVARELYKQGVQIPYDYSIIEGVELGDNTKKGWKEFGELLKISTDLIQSPKTNTDGKPSISSNFINKVWVGEMTVDEAIKEANQVSNDGLKKYLDLHPNYDASIYMIPDYDVKR